MKDWVVLFCIVSLVFAAFVIVYVVAGVVREQGKKDYEERSVRAKPACPAESKDRHMAIAMLCGTAFVISGLLVLSALSGKRTPSRGRRGRRY